MNNTIKRTWNQGSMVNIEDLRGMTFQAESGAHTFVISAVDANNNPITLSGTPSGTMLRPDNTDQALTCSVSDGKVYATLPAGCYDVPGRAGITIFLTSGGQKTAIYAAVVSVTRTQSGTASPGTTASVVDLVNAIAAAVATIPASYTDLMAAMAPTYSSSGLYAVGSYAWYNGKLYRCTTAITSGETWTSGHWTLANLGSDLVDLKSAINLNNGNQIVDFIIGKQITTNSSPVDPTNLITNANAKCAVIQCSEGDAFVINGNGGNGARLWCFCDSNNIMLSVADANATLTNEVKVAPASASYLVVNITSNAHEGIVIKGLSIDKRFNETEQYIAKEKAIDVEEKNTYSPDNTYIPCENKPNTIYNSNSGTLTSAEAKYGYSAVIPIADYNNNIFIRFSDAINGYWKLRIIVASGNSVAAINTENKTGNLVYRIKASTMKSWVDSGYDKVIVSAIGYTDSGYSTFKNYPINTFIDAYYIDNSDEPDNNADETDYLRVLKVAELPYNKTYDLFVFGGQSNMMGASAIPPADDDKCYFAYEYKYNPKRRGNPTGEFVYSKHSAGEWSYKDIETAYAPGNIDAQGRSKTAYYTTNTYFISAMANKIGEGTVAAFNTYSESTAQMGQSLPPFFANEYASYGCPCVYAQMAKGGVSIDYYFDSDVKAFFEEKFSSMLADFPTLMQGCSIRSKNFVWLQGESDTAMTKVQYKEKLEALWTWLQTLGFENFFCVRVGYFGSTSITKIMIAQEEFCNENAHCYIVTRAESYMLYPNMDAESFYVTAPGEEYQECRDSYLGYSNDHINTKGNKLVAKRAAANIYRVLVEGEAPILEEENVTALAN